MATDLEIIKQLEQEIGKELEFAKHDVYKQGGKKNFYIIDEYQKITDLNIDGNGLVDVPQKIF